MDTRGLAAGLRKKFYLRKKRPCKYTSVCMCWAFKGWNGPGQVFSPLGNCLFHTACYWDWAIPFLCLLALWSQECTHTHRELSSSRFGKWTLVKRKSLSLHDYKNHIRRTLDTTLRESIWGRSYADAGRGEM